MKKHGPHSILEQGLAGQTYVYMLLQHGGLKFKIGVSNEPSKRASQFMGFMDLNFDLSIMAKYPTRSRAIKVESAMHYALNDFKTMPLWYETRCDGYTEWFSVEGWHVALNLIRRMPTEHAKQVEIYNFKGELQDNATIRMDNKLHLLHSSMSPNVMINIDQINELCYTFWEISEDVKLGVLKFEMIEKRLPAIKHTKPDGAGPHKGTRRSRKLYELRILGLHSRWDAQELRLRRMVMNLEMYKFVTFSERHGEKWQSLIHRIERCGAEKDCLVLHMHNPAMLKKLPAGEKLYEEWTTVLEELRVEQKIFNMLQKNEHVDFDDAGLLVEPKE